MILGFLSTISLTSSTCAGFICAFGEVCTLSSSPLSRDMPSDASSSSSMISPGISSVFSFSISSSEVEFESSFLSFDSILFAGSISIFSYQMQES